MRIAQEDPTGQDEVSFERLTKYFPTSVNQFRVKKFASFLNIMFRIFLRFLGDVIVQ